MGAFAIASLVHALTVVTMVLGIALLVAGWPNLFLIAAGVLLLCVAWLLRPRLPKLEEDVLARERFPGLYALADRVAMALGTSPVDGIVLIAGFNAAFGRFGMRRRRVVSVGLPLLLVCDREERVALLGHELAHSVNGDPNRGLFVGTALNSLLTWHYLARPGKDVSAEGGLFALATIPVNLVMLALAQLVWLVTLALLHLTFRDSQRAEYLADYLGATVGGTAAMQTMLTKLYLDQMWDHTVQRTSLSQTSDSPFQAFRIRAAAVSEDYLDAMKAKSLDEMQRLDVTHPPTSFRVEFLISHQMPVAKVVLSQADSDQIEQELLPLQVKLGRAAIEAHRRSLEVVDY